MRFHPGKDALLVVATTEDGAAQAVQFIHLDEFGEKLDREEVEARELPGVKWTYGPLDGAAVRLPGDPAGPLLIAEGFESGYSGFASTGHETWIALGSVGRIELPVGRKVVVLGDDDAVGSPADKVLREVLSDRCRDGFDVAVATPWAARRGDRSDFNDLIRADGPAAVAARIEAALAAPSVAPRAAPAHGLPAYHPAPVEPREQALTGQAALIHDVIAQGAVGAVVRREIARLRDEAVAADPGWDERAPSHKAAVTRRIKRGVLEQHGLTQVARPRRALVTGAQGTGKTHRALVETAALTGDIVAWVTEPSLAKAEEALGDYLGLRGPDSLPGVLVRGRSADDPTGGERAKMCPRHEIATRAALKGVQVRSAICGSCPLRPTETQAGCSYLQQEARIKAMGSRGVFFGSSAYNFLSCPAPPPDILIADESITLAALDNTLTLAPDVLEGPVPFKGARLADVITANQITTRLRDALMDPAPLAKLRQDGPTRDEMVFAHGLLEAAVEARQIAPVSGAMADKEIERVLDDAKANTAGVALVVIGAVLRELDQPRDVLNGVTYDPARRVVVDGREEWLPRLRVHRLRRLRNVTQATTILLLDGTGSERLNRALVPDLEFHRFAIERDAYVTGTKGKSYSRQSCTGEDRNGAPIPNKVEDARRLRLDIKAVAARQPGPAFIVATRRTAEKLRDEGAVPDPENIAHFGKLRGRNDWEDCASGVSVGAESISVAAVEDLARPFMVNDPIPFVSMARKPDEGWAYQQWPYRATRGRRMRDGSVQSIEVEVHPDPRVQDVLEQVREAEVLQGIDRSRPIFNHRKLVLLNSLALDLTYDRVLTHREVVAGGGRLEFAFATLGLLPLGAADLATACPATAFRDGFASKATAKDCLDKLAESGGVLQIEYYLGNPPTYSYRRAGQRGSASRALIDVRRHPNPRVALEAVLGPLAADPVLLNVEPDPPPPEPPAPPPIEPVVVDRPFVPIVPPVPAGIWANGDSVLGAFALGHHGLRSELPVVVPVRDGPTDGAAWARQRDG